MMNGKLVIGNSNYMITSDSHLLLGHVTPRKRFARVSWIWISMDISMDIHIHVWISDLGHNVDISMDMYILFNSN